MAEVRVAVEGLRLAVTDGDFTNASHLIKSLQDYFEDDLTQAEIDLSILSLFSKDSEENQNSLIEFIKNVFADPNFSDSVSGAFVLMGKLLEGDFKTKLDIYVESIVYVSLKVLRSGCTAKIKEKCLLPLNSVAHGPWPNAIPDIIEVLTKHVNNKAEKPTVMAKEFELIGLLSHRYPELVGSNSEVIGKSFLKVIEESVEGNPKAKISFPLLEGCFNGLVGYMENFFESNMIDIVYRGVKTFSNPGDQFKRGHSRASLLIISKHGEHFQKELHADYEYWHVLLIKWLNQSNATDKKTGYTGLFSFYKNVGDFLMKTRDTTSCLKYFMDYFKRILSEKYSSNADKTASVSYESKYALKGFTTFISRCKSLFEMEEFNQISEEITQRAIMLYADNDSVANEETTEKIEELCNHVEALTAIGINVDNNLENLVGIIISDFPKCLNHRQYIVIKAVKKAFRVIDLQKIILLFIRESCKHYISTNLYYKSSDESSDHLSYENFIPLWSGILEINNDDITQKSQKIYDEFLSLILKILPTLDLSIKINPIHNASNGENAERDFTDLEIFEMPESAFDYRFFTNACDLTATIISYGWTHDWLIKWIDPFISMLLVGIKNQPKTAGYLKIAEAVLKVIKRLNILESSKLDQRKVHTDTERMILELLMELSISNSSGIFQLRSALVFLQAPPQLLNNVLIEKAATVFKIIFRIGKTKLDFVSSAIEILEEWNLYLEKDDFMPLCKEVMPELNEYLCSSGISDIITIESKNESDSTRNLYKNKKLGTLKEGISPQLATIQRRIILFMGKLDTMAIEPLFIFNESNETDQLKSEDSNILYMVERLKVSLPCIQHQKFNLYLDTLVPRVIELSLHSTNRDTRLTACQTLHSIILLMYGTCVSLPISQKSSLSSIQIKLNTAMLYLSADSDAFVSSMFTPLLKQSCHWLANPINSQSIETSNLISVLLKGAAHQSDNMISEMSCQAIKELIIWSMEKSTPEQLDQVPSNISAILRSICQMMLYPDDSQQRGGYLIFNCVVQHIYNMDSAIDKYLLEILFSIVKSIENSHNDIKIIITPSNNIYADLGLRALDKILRCLEKKMYIFKKPSVNRRRPPNFGDGVLEDIALWLLSQFKNFYREVATRCIKAFIKICESLCGNSREFFDKVFLKEGIQYCIKQYFENENIFLYSHNHSEFKKTVKTVYSLYISVDIYNFAIENKIFEIDSFFAKIQRDDANVFSAVKSFFVYFNEKNYENFRIQAFSDYTIIQKESLEKLIFQTVWKIYEFIFNISSIDSTVTKSFISDISAEFLKSLISWTINPLKLSIVRINIDNQQRKLKSILLFIKENMNDVWMSYVDNLTTSLNEYEWDLFLLNMNIQFLSSDKTKVLCLNYISDIFSVLEFEKKNQMLSMFNISDSLIAMFNNLFNIKDNIYEVADLDSSTLHSMGIIIQFILHLNTIDSRTILSILISDIPIKDTSYDDMFSKRSFTYGKYCLYKFQNEFLSFITDNSEGFFDEFLEKILTANKNEYIALLEDVMKYFSEKINDGNEMTNIFCDNLTSFYKKLWVKFVEWDIPFRNLSQLYSLLTVLLPQPLISIGSDENSLSSWLLNSFCNEVSVEKRTMLIILLPTILESGDEKLWYNEKVLNGLQKFRESFPLSSHEFSPHSKDRSNYLKTMKAILEALANCGSFMLLECVIYSNLVDENHLCEDQISHKLKSFINRLTYIQQSKVLIKVYKISDGNMLSDNSMLFNLVKRFFMPLLLNSSPDALETFFTEVMPTVYELLEKQISINSSQYQSERILVHWTTSYRMLEVMFLKVPFTKIDSIDSKIAANYKKSASPQQFVKDIFTKAFQMRKIEPSLGNFSERALEYLRLAHCAAYKCLYAITIARRKIETKSYLILLNHKITSSNKFWEGMIDSKKIYNFPLKTSQLSKKKSHSVASKSCETNSSPFNGSMFTLDESMNILMSSKQSLITKTIKGVRHHFLRQTLTEDFSKFDFNTTIIRESLDEWKEIDTQASNNISKSSLLLDDDELNNHECMATVCKIIHEINKISSNSTSENSMNNTLFSTQINLSSNSDFDVPEWVKCIAAILKDRSRVKNVRLFLAQAVDNARDVFKQYAKIMFIPILSVVQDRCTSHDSKINYLDTCLISLVLSWNNLILPYSNEEILSASAVLRFLISEINLSSQSLDIFKHCLEILQSIVKFWGHFLILPYDLLIENIEGESESKKGALQMVAILLLNNKIPWESMGSYKRYYKSIISGLKSIEKNVYKLTAEVIGMTLKILMNGANSNEKISPMQDTREESWSDLGTDLLTEIQKYLSHLFANKSFDKFIFCLHDCQKYFSKVCDESFLSKILFLFPKFPAEQKKICLKIFLNSIEVMSSEFLYGELSTLEIEKLLKSRDFRITSLHIINKSLNYLSKTQNIVLSKYIDSLCALSTNRDTECRSVAFEILMKFYTLLNDHRKTPQDEAVKIIDPLFQEPTSSRKRICSNDSFGSRLSKDLSLKEYEQIDKNNLLKSSLLCGLNDDDKQIKDRVFQFWSEQFSSNIYKRWIETIDEFLCSECVTDENILGKLLQIVMSACQQAPDYKTTKVFENPLEECRQIDYDWKTTHTKQNHTLAPIFAETLNSQLLMSTIIQNNENGKTPRNRDIRALKTIANSTQGTFVKPEEAFLRNSVHSFGASFISGGIMSLRQDTIQKSYQRNSIGFSLEMGSSLLFTLEPEEMHRQTYKPLPKKSAKDDNADEDLLKKLRKKYISNKRQEAIKFSGISAFKHKTTERNRLKSKQIESFKNFKDGDYPDVQIYLNDILSPLLELAMRDFSLSKELFVILFKSLKLSSDNSLMNLNQEPGAKTEIYSILKSFSQISTYSTLNSLKLFSKSGMIASLATALFQLCQICLADCCDSNEFNSIIGNSAKTCGIEWFGTLLLEEKEILNIPSEPLPKRRRSNSCDEKNILSDTLNDEIYALKVIGNWPGVQDIYSNAAVDSRLSEETRLYYTEEYFQCFARLSNWEHLKEQIGYQFSTDNSDAPTESHVLFDYELLWKKSWMTDIFLPMMFDANIYTCSSLSVLEGFAQVDKTNESENISSLNHFDAYVNKWIADKEREPHLLTQLSPKLAAWKSVFGSDNSSLGYVNTAMEWIRNQWIQECLLRNNKILQNHTNDVKKLTLYKLQMMAEIYNFLELPMFSGSSSRYSENYLNKKIIHTISTWENCIPLSKDDTLTWDMRLACRNIFSSRLQKIMKTKMNDMSIDDDWEYSSLIKHLSKTQRLAELCLVKIAIEQSNYLLADKYIKKHWRGNLTKEEEILWGLQWAKTLKIKAKSQVKLETKLKYTLEAWKRGEDVRISYAPDDDLYSFVHLLINAAELSYEVKTILKQLDQKNIKINTTDLNKSLIEIIGKGQLFKDPIASSVMNPDTLNNMFIEYGKLYLKESYKMAEKHLSNKLKRDREMDDNSDTLLDAYKHQPKTKSLFDLVSNTYLTLGNYCRQINNDNGTDLESTISTLIMSILRSMKFGNIEARKLFPILLIEIEHLPSKENIFQLFKNEIKDIPTWLFLPWVSQILAHLPTLNDILLDLVLQIATDYPQGIVHQYRLSKRMWKMSTDNSSMIKSNVEKLDKLLINEKTELLVKALGSICDPNTLIKNHLEFVFKALGTNDKEKWDAAFEDLFEEVFPTAKVRGTAFHNLKSYKSELNDIWKNCTNENIQNMQESIFHLMKKFMQSENIHKSSKSLRDYSPYLSSYENNSICAIDVFGQYGKFENCAPFPQKHVTIAQFDNTVMVIRSLRKPIRITIIGSNGLKYYFLVKRGEDLRQDERVQQLFNLMNDYLNEDGMKINTYKVTPLTWDLGIIQWLQNYSTLKDVISEYDSKTKELIFHAVETRKNYVDNVAGDSKLTFDVKYGEMALNIHKSERSYNVIVENIPKYILRDALVKLATSPDNFIRMRNNYTQSLAPMSISQWILGVGDRHMSNCLLSAHTGDVVGIDFGHTFGTATQLLLIPELVPFRLTPQILNVLAPYGAKGYLRQQMIRALDKFVENSQMLLAAMEVFIYEPSINWCQFIKKNKSCPSEDQISPSIEEYDFWSPRTKINQCKRKLTGVIPAVITLEDLKARNNQEYVEYYCKVVRNCLSGFDTEDLEKNNLTTTQQVDCLINQATNSAILSIAYFQWEPWL